MRCCHLTAGEQEYFGNQRLELIELVDDSAMTILDVGCGYGMLGSALKKRINGRRVLGIEIMPDAAREAKTVLDQVVNTDIENIDLPFPKENFDCIIFADILEHLKDPLSVILRLKPYLKKSGCVVCSIPNMRHYTALLRLLTRGWEYDDFGLFDRTHLRFFSLKTMRQLMEDAGLTIELIKPKIEASKKARILNRLLFGRLEEFVAMQYLVKARNI